MADGRRDLRAAGESVKKRLDGEVLNPHESDLVRSRIDATLMTAERPQSLFKPVLAFCVMAAAAVVLFVVLRARADGALQVAQGAACVVKRGTMLSVDSHCSEPVDIHRHDDLIVAKAGAVVQDTSEGVRVRHGEVSFTVHKRTDGDTFRVYVSHGFIEVIGTEFVVRQSDTMGTVHLSSGKIAFHAVDGPVTMLLPGDELLWPAPPPADDEPVAQQAMPEPDLSEPDAPVVPQTKNKPDRRQHGGGKIAPEAQVAPAPSVDVVPLEEVLRRMFQLRSQRRYSDAATLLREQLTRQDFSGEQRMRLSFELGVLLQDRMGDTAAACKHWQQHAREFPKDREHAPQIADYLQNCAAR